MPQTDATAITENDVESTIVCLREIGKQNVECAKPSDPVGYLLQRMAETGKTYEGVPEDDPEHILYKDPEPVNTPAQDRLEPTPLPQEPQKTVTPAEPPAPSPAAASTPFNEAVRPTIQTGREYHVPDNFDPVLKAITENDPISYDLMVKVLGSESNFNNNAVSSSGAFSAGQFVRSTYLENVWKHQDLLSPEHKNIISENMKRYNSAPRGEDPVYKFRIKDGGNEQAVMDLSDNEYVVSVLAREHLRQAITSGETRYRSLIEERLNWLTKPENENRLADDHPRVERLREHLERPMTFTDAKTFYLCGSRGGAELLVAHADTTTQDHRAKDYTTDTVARNNKPVFENPDGTNKSVPEYIDYMHERVGNQPLPANLERTAPQSHAALTL